MLYAFAAYFRNSNPMKFQVWRPVNLGTRSYQLIKEWSITPTVVNGREDVSVLSLSNIKYNNCQSSRNMPDMPDMSGRVLLMSGKGLRPCRTFCPAGFNICQLSPEKNVWHGDQNVRQSSEDLPDILSGRPEIIFARTATVYNNSLESCPH